MSLGSRILEGSIFTARLLDFAPYPMLESGGPHCIRRSFSTRMCGLILLRRIGSFLEVVVHTCSSYVNFHLSKRDLLTKDHRWLKFAVAARSRPVSEDARLPCSQLARLHDSQAWALMMLFSSSVLSGSFPITVWNGCRTLRGFRL
jgi:hypothetical protein